MPSIVQLFNTLMKCTGASGNKAFCKSNLLLKPPKIYVVWLGFDFYEQMFWSSEMVTTFLGKFICDLTERVSISVGI